MKYKFGDSTIVTGFIKELLHSFNLPKIPVYKDDIELYEDRSYIKENKIVKYENGKFKNLATYTYNKPIINLTKTLVMNSARYDTYTHNYLGDYLRFLRDYNKLDLMGMYNCFSGDRPLSIDFSYSNDNINYVVDTTNNSYNYYLIPVKFNQVYTIAIDAEINYELSCILYNNIFIENTPEALIQESLKSISGSKFTKPFIYDTHFSCANTTWVEEVNTRSVDDSSTYKSKTRLWRREDDLKLLLKLPKEVTSSIVILEGDYTACANIIDGNLATQFVYNEEELPDVYYSKSELLSVNNQVSYPFADRLVEFLIGQAITNIDQFSSNVMRVQDALYQEESLKGYYGMWDKNLRNTIYSLQNKPDITKGSPREFNEVLSPGRSIKGVKRYIDIYNDTTGFVDKDTESLLRLL